MKEKILKILKERHETYDNYIGSTVGETRLMYHYKAEAIKEMIERIEKEIKDGTNE